MWKWSSSVCTLGGPSDRLSGCVVGVILMVLSVTLLGDAYVGAALGRTALAGGREGVSLLVFVGCAVAIWTAGIPAGQATECIGS